MNIAPNENEIKKIGVALWSVFLLLPFSPAPPVVDAYHAVHQHDLVLSCEALADVVDDVQRCEVVFVCPSKYVDFVGGHFLAPCRVPLGLPSMYSIVLLYI